MALVPQIQVPQNPYGSKVQKKTMSIYPNGFMMQHKNPMFFKDDHLNHFKSILVYDN